MNTPLTPEQKQRLEERLRTAHLELCVKNKCECITRKEHERNLAAAKAAGIEKKK